MNGLLNPIRRGGFSVVCGFIGEDAGANCKTPGAGMVGAGAQDALEPETPSGFTEGGLIPEISLIKVAYSLSSRSVLGSKAADVCEGQSANG